MKTIFVVLGVGAVVGVGALLLSASGVTHDRTCPRVTMNEAVGKRINAAMPKLVQDLTPDSSGLDLLQAMFRAGFPNCAFDLSSPTIIVGEDGREVAWPTIVEATRGKSLATIASDPDFPALFGGGAALPPGMEGAGFLDSVTILREIIRKFSEAAVSTLVPYVPDGKTWGADEHYYHFVNYDKAEYGGSKPIVTNRDKGRWSAYVAKDNSLEDFYGGVDGEPTEVSALNKVRLTAYYGP